MYELVTPEAGLQFEQIWLKSIKRHNKYQHCRLYGLGYKDL